MPNVSGEINFAPGAVSVFETESVAGQRFDVCRSDHEVNMALTPQARKRSRDLTGSGQMLLVRRWRKETSLSSGFRDASHRFARSSNRIDRYSESPEGRDFFF